MKIDRLSIWFLLKAREFHRLGYRQVSAKQIREYCDAFLWKRQKPETYKQLKVAIKNITPNQFFDYQTLRIQMDQNNDVSQIDFSQLD